MSAHLDLQAVLAAHAAWLNVEASGKRAYLSVAYLSDANLSGAKMPLLDGPPQGDLVGYKKTRQGVVTLMIPVTAKRSAATSRKCRAEFAIVTTMPSGVTEAQSLHNASFAYRLGETVRPHEWCEDRWKECAGGIHFFLTREEAEAWQ